MASSKDLKPLIRQARKQGWTVEDTRGGGKLKWISPRGGVPYFSSKTPSDRRAIHNISADLTKRGLTV